MARKPAIQLRVAAKAMRASPPSSGATAWATATVPAAFSSHVGT